MSDPFAALRLEGKVLAITGATQGLGAAIARRAADLGAAGIAVCGRNRERGEAVCETLAGDAAFVAVELEDAGSCLAVMPAVEARFGRLDGLVNAAGLSSRGTLDDTSAELWDRLFAVNARAPFLLTQGAARLMRSSGGGSVVNIVTMASHGGEPVLTAYAASKAALATFTRNAGYSLQPDRIRVNGLNIGWTATEGEHAVQTATGQPEDWLEQADAGRPLGRLLRPEDIAPMVTYLLSDAAQMVTGSVIDFDQTVLGPSGEHVAMVPA
ncbi:MAG TPA: SDR family oxidoreductase [Solirubrobacter sp.]|nr:SDR family oxidoreductase [Solirubrobacter sp.]